MKKFCMIFTLLLIVICLTACGSKQEVIILNEPIDVQIYEGDSCSFSVTCENADNITWYFYDSITLTLGELKSQYPNMNITESKGMVILENVPRDLDNFEVFCICSNKYSTKLSQFATLMVLEKEPQTLLPWE